MIVLTVPIPKGLHRRLTAEAKQRMTSKAALARQMLANSLGWDPGKEKNARAHHRTITKTL